jgi:hypothetical protein
MDVSPGVVVGGRNPTGHRWLETKLGRAIAGGLFECWPYRPSVLLQAKESLDRDERREPSSPVHSVAPETTPGVTDRTVTTREGAPITAARAVKY